MRLPESSHYKPGEEDRLGVYTQTDPCSVVHTVMKAPLSMFSSNPLKHVPQIGENVTFDELKFTYYFQVKLCDDEGNN